MILVDTSVLIDYFKNSGNQKTELFQRILDRKLPFGITELIYLELLQRAKNNRELNLLKEYLKTMFFYTPTKGLTSYEEAAQMYSACRNAGVTVRSTIDVLIAQISIENGLYLLHNDKDFDTIASVITDLQICNSVDFS